MILLPKHGICSWQGSSAAVFSQGLEESAWYRQLERQDCSGNWEGELGRGVGGDSEKWLGEATEAKEKGWAIKIGCEGEGRGEQEIGGGENCPQCVKFTCQQGRGHFLICWPLLPTSILHPRLVIPLHWAHSQDLFAAQSYLCLREEEEIVWKTINQDGWEKDTLHPSLPPPLDHILPPKSHGLSAPHLPSPPWVPLTPQSHPPWLPLSSPFPPDLWRPQSHVDLQTQLLPSLLRSLEPSVRVGNQHREFYWHLKAICSQSMRPPESAFPRSAGWGCAVITDRDKLQSLLNQLLCVCVFFARKTQILSPPSFCLSRTSLWRAQKLFYCWPGTKILNWFQGPKRWL